MMRTNETPADPALCHICLSLKNRLFHGAGAGGHHVHTKHAGNARHDRSFTHGPSGGRAGLHSCLLGAGPAGPSLGLLQAARHPCTVRLMALGSPAANRSLSRNKPLHWQVRGTVPRLPCPGVQHLEGTSQPGPSEEMARDVGQCLSSRPGTSAVLLWGRECGLCLLTAASLYTHRMRICKWENGQILIYSPAVPKHFLFFVLTVLGTNHLFSVTH